MLTWREKEIIEIYLYKIEQVKKYIINRTRRQNMWFESDCGYEIANNFHLRYLYARVDKIIDKL